jgi:hypothetical protein
MQPIASLPETPPMIVHFRELSPTLTCEVAVAPSVDRRFEWSCGAVDAGGHRMATYLTDSALGASCQGHSSVNAPNRRVHGSTSRGEICLHIAHGPRPAVLISYRPSVQYLVSLVPSALVLKTRSATRSQCRDGRPAGKGWLTALSGPLSPRMRGSSADGGEGAQRWVTGGY